MEYAKPWTKLFPERIEAVKILWFATFKHSAKQLWLIGSFNHFSIGINRRSFILIIGRRLHCRKECDTGYYSYGNQEKCIICPEGYECPSSTYGPYRCPVGYYSEAASINCTACEAGYACPRPEGTTLKPASRCVNFLDLQALHCYTWSSVICIFNSTQCTFNDNYLWIFLLYHHVGPPGGKRTVQFLTFPWKIHFSMKTKILTLIVRFI